MKLWVTIKKASRLWTCPDVFFCFPFAFCHFPLEGICCFACVWCAHLPPAFASYLYVLLFNRMGSCPVCLHNASSSAWRNERFYFGYKLTCEIWSLCVSSWFFLGICKAQSVMISSSAHVLGGVSHKGCQASHWLPASCQVYSRHWPSAV